MTSTTSLLLASQVGTNAGEAPIESVPVDGTPPASAEVVEQNTMLLIVLPVADIPRVRRRRSAWTIYEFSTPSKIGPRGQKVGQMAPQDRFFMDFDRFLVTFLESFFDVFAKR